jgi:hypothetical protein
LSHKGRQYEQINRRWLSPGSSVPFFAPKKWFGEFIVYEGAGPFFPTFGIVGESLEGVDDPVALTITWTWPAVLDPGCTYTFVQSFVGPDVHHTIRADLHAGGFCEHVYKRSTPFDYHNVDFVNGFELSRTFAAPCNGAMSMDAAAVPYH